MLLILNSNELVQVPPPKASASAMELAGTTSNSRRFDEEQSRKGVKQFLNHLSSKDEKKLAEEEIIVAVPLDVGFDADADKPASGSAYFKLGKAKGKDLAGTCLDFQQEIVEKSQFKGVSEITSIKISLKGKTRSERGECDSLNAASRRKSSRKTSKLSPKSQFCSEKASFSTSGEVPMKIGPLHSLDDSGNLGGSDSKLTPDCSLMQMSTVGISDDSKQWKKIVDTNTGQIPMKVEDDSKQWKKIVDNDTGHIPVKVPDDSKQWKNIVDKDTGHIPMKVSDDSKQWKKIVDNDTGHLPMKVPDDSKQWKNIVDNDTGHIPMKVVDDSKQWKSIVDNHTGHIPMKVADDSKPIVIAANNEEGHNSFDMNFSQNSDSKSGKQEESDEDDFSPFVSG